jgi:hypothetical protein
MEATTQNFNNVVVVGYSSQRKASISGAVSTVDMDDLRKTRIADVDASAGTLTQNDGY